MKLLHFQMRGHPGRDSRAYACAVNVRAANGESLMGKQTKDRASKAGRAMLSTAEHRDAQKKLDHSIIGCRVSSDEPLDNS